MQLYFEYGWPAGYNLFNYSLIGVLVNLLFFLTLISLILINYDFFSTKKVFSIIFVPLWQFLMRKFEKRYIFIVGNLVNKYSIHS